MSADIGRRMLLFGRWLLESLIKLLVGWVRFLIGSRRSFGVGVVAAVLLVAADEIPGPKGTPAIDQLPTNVLYAITVLELFIVASGMRLVSASRTAGWIRFIGAWICGGLAYVLFAPSASQLAATGRYPAGGREILATAGAAVALLAAAAMYNWAALKKILAAERTHTTARLTRGRILTAVARRPLPVPAAPAYSLWYAWAACALSASPAAAHRAAEAAVSALRSGANARDASNAAKRSIWTPAGVVDRFRSTAGGDAA
ncbi:MAG: hypothetical protein AUH69_04865 [Actinobacteria bacterium 13_1_40CM_4_65_12]|nr:MAG: hypothetical protein AUH40_05190 [Chloroflexi bacterium 13_1_40CM_65_17]OLC67279.1 MAG: hypothetical protein AUH69_04865 [Actinobacteria bacterium 13_1_40CM_4_65_12]